MKIGSVLKIKIEGKMVSCIIIGDLIEGYSAPGTGNFNYLSLGGGETGHIILNDRVALMNYYKTLMGDTIVYVETRDIGLEY